MSRQPENISAGFSAESGPHLRSTGGTSVSSVGPANWIIEGKFLQGWNTGKQWLQYRLSNNWLPGSSKASTISGPSTKSATSERFEIGVGKQPDMLALSSRSSATDYRRRSNSFSNHRSERLESQGGENGSNSEFSVETSWKSVPKWIRELQSFNPEVQSSQGSVSPNLVSASSTSDVALQRPVPGFAIDEPPTSLSAERLPSMSNICLDCVEGLRLKELRKRTVDDRSTGETSTLAKESVSNCIRSQGLLSSHRVDFDVEASFSSCELGSFTNRVNPSITVSESHVDSREENKSTLLRQCQSSKGFRKPSNRDHPSPGEEDIALETPYTSRTTSRSTKTADILDGMSELLQSSGSSSTSFPSVHSPDYPGQGYDGNSLSTAASRGSPKLLEHPSKEQAPKIVVKTPDDSLTLSMAQQAPQEHLLGHFQQFCFNSKLSASPRDVTVDMPGYGFGTGPGGGNFLSKGWSGHLPMTQTQAGGEIYKAGINKNAGKNQSDEGQSSYEPLLPNQHESEHEVDNPLWEAKRAHSFGRSKDSISSKVAAVYNTYRDRAARASFVRNHKDKLKRSTCVLFVLFLLLLGGIVAASLLIPRATERKKDQVVEVVPSSNLSSTNSSSLPSVTGSVGGGGDSDDPNIADQSIFGDNGAAGETDSQGKNDSTLAQAPLEAEIMTMPNSRPPSAPMAPPPSPFQSSPPPFPSPSPLPPQPPASPTAPTQTQLSIATCSVEEGITIRNLDSLPVGPRQELLTSIQGPALATLRTNLRPDECYKINTALNDYGDGTKELEDFLTPFSSYLIISVAPKTPEGRRRLQVVGSRHLTESFGDLTVVYEPGMETLEASFSPPDNSIISVTTAFNIDGRGTRTRSFVFDVIEAVEPKDIDSDPPGQSPPSPAVVELPASSMTVGGTIESPNAPGVPPESSDLERTDVVEAEEEFNGSPRESDLQGGIFPSSASKFEDRGENSKETEEDVDDDPDGEGGLTALWPASRVEEDISLERSLPGGGLTATSPSEVASPPRSGLLVGSEGEPEPSIEVVQRNTTSVLELPQPDDNAHSPERLSEWGDEFGSFPEPADSANESEGVVEDTASEGEGPVSEGFVPTDIEFGSLAYGPAQTEEKFGREESDGSQLEMDLPEALHGPAPAPGAYPTGNPSFGGLPGSHGSYGSYGSGSYGDRIQDPLEEGERDSLEFWKPQSAPMEDLLEDAPKEPSDVFGDGQHGTEAKTNEDIRELEEMDIENFLEDQDGFSAANAPEAAPPADTVQKGLSITEQTRSFGDEAESTANIDDEDIVAQYSTGATDDGDHVDQENLRNIPNWRSRAPEPASEAPKDDGNHKEDEFDELEGDEQSSAAGPSTGRWPGNTKYFGDAFVPDEFTMDRDTPLMLEKALLAPSLSPASEIALDSKALRSDIDESPLPQATIFKDTPENGEDDNNENMLGNRDSQFPVPAPEVMKQSTHDRESDFVGSEVDVLALAPSSSRAETNDDIGDDTMEIGFHDTSLPPALYTNAPQSGGHEQDGTAVIEGVPIQSPSVSTQYVDSNNEFVGNKIDGSPLAPVASPEYVTWENEGMSGRIGERNERSGYVAPAPSQADWGAIKSEVEFEHLESETLGVTDVGPAPSSTDSLNLVPEKPSGDAHATSEAPSAAGIMESTGAVESPEPEPSLPLDRDPQGVATTVSTPNEKEEQRDEPLANKDDTKGTSITEVQAEVVNGGGHSNGETDDKPDIGAAEIGESLGELAIESQANPTEMDVASSSVTGEDDENDAFSLWWLWVVMGGVAGISAIAFYVVTHESGGQGLRNMTRISPGPHPEAQSEVESSRGSVLPDMDPNSPRGAPTSIAIWNEQERTAKMRADLDSAGHGGPKKRGAEGDPSVLSSVYFPFKTLFGAIHTGINTVFSKENDAHSEKVVVSPSRPITPEPDSERCIAPDEGPSSRVGESTQPEQEGCATSARSTIPTIPNAARKESSGGYLGDAVSTGSEIGGSDMDVEEAEEPLIPRNVGMSSSTEGSSVDWPQPKGVNDFHEPPSPSFSPRVAIKGMVTMVSAIYRKVWKKSNRISSSSTSYTRTSKEQSMHWATKVQTYSADTSGVSLRTDLPSLDSYYAEVYGAAFPEEPPQDHKF